MFYTVEELAIKFNTSKVTIYKKFKLPSIKPFVVKEEGKFKLKEEALNLLEEIFKVKDEVNSSEPEGEVASTSLNVNLISVLTDEVEFLRSEIKEKNKQIEHDGKLLENMQVLIKQEQDNYKREFLQDQKYKDLDKQLRDLANNKEPETPKQSLLKRIFNFKKT